MNLNEILQTINRRYNNTISHIKRQNPKVKTFEEIMEIGKKEAYSEIIELFKNYSHINITIPTKEIDYELENIKNSYTDNIKDYWFKTSQEKERVKKEIEKSNDVVNDIIEELREFFNNYK